MTVKIQEIKEVKINMTAKKSRPINRINKQKEIEQKKRKRKKKALVIFLILIVLIALSGYLFISPTFKIQTITVTGNKQLTKEKVLELANIKTGDNIFLKSKEVIRVRLKQNGVVEEAKINKLYPSRVEIEITERSKRFQIKTQSENYIYIDEQGYILECTSEKLKLPVITGMEITENEANNSKRLNDKNLDIMENILQIYQECKKIKIDEKITEIQVNDEYVLKLEQDGIAINLGNATNLKDRMYFVKKLLEEEKENKGTIYVNGNLNEGFSPYFSAIQ